MKQLSSQQEKKILDLESKWLRHKRLRNKAGNHDHKDWLTMRDRELLLDQLFIVIFND